MAIDLLLLEDVDSLGRSGDIVTVKPGYARNFLVPKKLALLADRNTRRMQQKLQEARAEKALFDKAEAEELARQSQDRCFVVEVKVDPDGNMYGSVAALDILRLFEQEGIALEKKNIHLPHPLKSLGAHQIELRLKEGVKSSCIVKIVAEGQLEAETPVQA